MKKDSLNAKKSRPAKAKVKDREITEAKLLQAAESIFSKYGFNGATTRMIANKADVNLALINRYFDGKYGLLIKIVELKAKEFATSELPYAPSQSITEELTNYCKFVTDLYIENIDFYKITIVQFLTDSTFLKKSKDLINLFSINQELLKRLNKLKRDKNIGPEFDTEVIAMTIEDIVSSQITYEILMLGTKTEALYDRQERFIKVLCSRYE